MRAHFCLLACAFLVASCGRYAEVSHVQPHLAGAAGTGPLAEAERAMAKAMQEERTQPMRALGDCLLALQAATRELEHNSNNAIALRDYDFGIARIFQIIHGARLDPWNAPLTVPSSNGN